MKDVNELLLSATRAALAAKISGLLETLAPSLCASSFQQSWAGGAAKQPKLCYYKHDHKHNHKHDHKHSHKHTAGQMFGLVHATEAALGRRKERPPDRPSPRYRNQIFIQSCIQDHFYWWSQQNLQHANQSEEGLMKQKNIHLRKSSWRSFKGEITAEVLHRNNEMILSEVHCVWIFVDKMKTIHFWKKYSVRNQKNNPGFFKISTVKNVFISFSASK